LVNNGITNQSVRALAISGTNIFAGTYGGGIFLSTNNGTNWVAVNNGITNLTVLSLAISGTNIFAGSGGVYYSSNNGANWILKNQGFTDIHAIISLIITNNYIFAGTGYYSVWRRLYDDILGIQNISTEAPLTYSLSQNYPNPFNPSTKISFALPKQGLVTIKVFDMLGKEIETLVNESLKPGTYEAAFDGSSYPSGVYFYRLTVRHGGSSTDGFVETKRMVMIK